MSTLILATIIAAFGIPTATIVGLVVSILFGGTNSERPTVADIQARLDGEER